jgi:hypothetical protein
VIAIAPAILMATTRDPSGTVWSLALVRTHYKSEGSCVLEAVNGNTGALICIDYATWQIKRSDTGPAALSVELPAYPGNDTVDDWHAIVTALLQVLLDRGASWGIEAIEP